MDKVERVAEIAAGLAEELTAIVKCTRHEDDALAFLTNNYDALLAAMQPGWNDAIEAARATRHPRTQEGSIMADLVERSLEAADDLDNMPSNYDARCVRLDVAAWLLRVDAEAIEALRAERDKLVEAGTLLGREAAMLLQNAEGCAVNHYGEDFAHHGMPGWLVQSRMLIEGFRTTLASLADGRGQD